MLLDIPTSMPLSEVTLTLPSTEELWCAPTSVEWSTLLPVSPPTPSFQSAFAALFPSAPPSPAAHRYSEFGGYVMISALLSGILNSYRLERLPPVSVDWRGFDFALDAWQRSWNADPKSHSTGPSSPFGAMAFNASAIYRATSIRRVKDYAKYTPDHSPLRPFPSVEWSPLPWLEILSCHCSVLCLHSFCSLCWISRSGSKQRSNSQMTN